MKKNIMFERDAKMFNDVVEVYWDCYENDIKFTMDILLCLAGCAGSELISDLTQYVMEDKIGSSFDKFFSQKKVKKLLLKESDFILDDKRWLKEFLKQNMAVDETLESCFAHSEHRLSSDLDKLFENNVLSLCSTEGHFFLVLGKALDLYQKKYPHSIEAYAGVNVGKREKWLKQIDELQRHCDAEYKVYAKNLKMSERIEALEILMESKVAKFDEEFVEDYYTSRRLGEQGLRAFIEEISYDAERRRRVNIRSKAKLENGQVVIADCKSYRAYSLDDRWFTKANVKGEFILHTAVGNDGVARAA